MSDSGSNEKNPTEEPTSATGGSEFDRSADSPRATDSAGSARASMSESIDQWVTTLAAELSIDPQDVPVGQILRTAKTVAHNAIRPGAPISAYAAGLAVGKGLLTPTEAFEIIQGAATAE